MLTYRSFPEVAIFIMFAQFSQNISPLHRNIRAEYAMESRIASFLENAQHLITMRVQPR
jgi:hypothetical protein